MANSSFNMNCEFLQSDCVRKSPHLWLTEASNTSHAHKPNDCCLKHCALLLNGPDAYRDQLLVVYASEPFHAGPCRLGPLLTASRALKGKGWEVDLVQAACNLVGGGIAEQHLAPCRHVREGLCQLHHLASVLHLLGDIVNLQHKMAGWI